MRILYQSLASIGHDPVYSAYESAMLEHMASVKGTETQVDIEGVPLMIPQSTEHAYMEYLALPQTIENAVRAEERGYEGLVIGCFTDPGHDILKSALHIPVTFSGEASMYGACLLGKKFTFLARTENTARRIAANVKLYGLSEKAVLYGVLNAPLQLLAQSFQDPADIIKIFYSKCEEVIKRGAEVIIPACGILSVLLAANKIKTYKGAVILDTLAFSLKFAEILVELKQKLGLDLSRIGDYRFVENSIIENARKALGK